ncbi:hypothetical protein M569_05804 [Genlisea aurea]|uniref:Uncharacterized protein n=1 Tax=Genlisea aurea TaxID=192259 RepID=S8CP85_9LAMI|nr:hypothetical protein M569_05804 [Genlisea aurea]
MNSSDCAAIAPEIDSRSSREARVEKPTRFAVQLNPKMIKLQLAPQSGAAAFLGFQECGKCENLLCSVTGGSGSDAAATAPSGAADVWDGLLTWIGSSLSNAGRVYRLVALDPLFPPVSNLCFLPVIAKQAQTV